VKIKMNGLSIGEKHETKVNYKKLLQDLRDQYPFDPLTALVIESFANSIDAGATQVDIYVDKNFYKIKDDGKGMDHDEFKEYHNIASLTKTKGSGGIGFAGLGAKVYLDQAEYIYTETKSTNFNGASVWSFHDDTPIWEVVHPKGLIDKTGTFIEVKLNPHDAGRITEEFVIRALQEHYNSVLLGLYGAKKVTVNGKKVEPWKPVFVERRHNFEFKVGPHRIIGFFIKTKDKEKVPEEFQGVSIVVCGKTVHKNEWFKQFVSCGENITGMIIADHLIQIVNTSKTQVNRTHILWKKFYGRVSQEFSRWLDEIGAKISPPEVPPDTSNMIRELEKSINKVLLNIPELSSLANILFQNIMRRVTAIKSATGELAGEEVEGAQRVSGTISGPTGGSGVETIGSDDGKGVIERENGNIKVEKVRRRMKAGIKIGFYEKPDDWNEGWIDPASQTVTVNTWHPAYKIACGLSIEGGMYHVWIYHLLRVVVRTLSKEAGEAPEKIEGKILVEWYNYMVDERIKQQINKLFPAISE